MKTRIGIVDLGTNTFHLMVAEINPESYSFIHKEKIPVNLGRGGINEKRISDEARERALKAAYHIREILNDLHVFKSVCVATSAIRNAENRLEIISEFSEITGLEVEVINGDKEAEFIFEGVNLALDLGENNSLVMDIGGGSVEFIIGSGKGIVWKQSFEIGAQRLMDKFQKRDPIAPKEIADVEKYILTELEPLYEAISLFNPDTLIGSSGTFDTLSEIYRLRTGIEIGNGQTELPLTIDAINAIHKEIILKKRNERLKIPGMVEMRVDMIVVASILIQVIFSIKPFEKVRVSSYALKEGIFSYVLKSIKTPA